MRNFHAWHTVIDECRVNKGTNLDQGWYVYVCYLHYVMDTLVRVPLFSTPLMSLCKLNKYYTVTACVFVNEISIFAYNSVINY